MKTIQPQPTQMLPSSFDILGKIDLIVSIMFKIFVSSLLTLILGLGFFGSTYKPKPVCTNCGVSNSVTPISSSSKNNIINNLPTGYTPKPACTIGTCSGSSISVSIISSSSSSYGLPLCTVNGPRPCFQPL